MTDAYQPPKSNLDNDDEQTATVRQLYREQSYVAALLGALFGLIPGLLLTYLILRESRGFVTTLILLIPGLAAGLMVKFCGRAFEARVRLPAAGLTFLAVVLVFWGPRASPLFFFIAFLNGLIVMGLSRRPLTYDQEKALYAYKLGKIRL